MEPEARSTMRALGGRPFYRYLLLFEKCRAGNQYSGRSPGARIVELISVGKNTTFTTWLKDINTAKLTPNDLKS